MLKLVICVSLHIVQLPVAHPGSPGQRAVKRYMCVCVFENIAG